MNEKMETDVITVGADPTGFALARQLIRYGVDFVIFDKISISDLLKNTANGLTAKTLRSRRASKKFSARTNLFGGYY